MHKKFLKNGKLEKQNYDEKKFPKHTECFSFREVRSSNKGASYLSLVDITALPKKFIWILIFWAMQWDLDIS